MHKHRNYSYIASRVFNEPLLIDETKAKIILGALSNRLMIDQINGSGGEVFKPSDMEISAMSDSENVQRKSLRFEDGLAIIPVEGTLVHRFGHLDPYSGMTGYDGIKTKLDMAINDSQVKGIVLDIDSPGGEAAGMLALSDAIFEARQQKPILAAVNEFSASAAYGIASAATEIVMPTTGHVGSVGVIMAHTDISRFLDNEGVTVTLIAAGARKTDGNQFEPLPADVLARFQQTVDEMRLLFAGSVARNRGISLEEVMNTEAGMFMGGDAIDVGFVDRIANIDESIVKFRQSLKTTTFFQGGQMTDSNPTPEASTEPVTVDVEKITAEAIQSERGRIKSILSLPEAEGRISTAIKLATETDMNSESASQILESIEIKEEEESKANAPTQLLDAALSGSQNPDITSSEDTDVNPELTRVLSTYKSFHGKGSVN